MFEFKNELTQAEWMSFKKEFENVLLERFKPILSHRATSDIHVIAARIEEFSSWLPYLGNKRSEADRFVKEARVQALEEQNCPERGEYKIKIFVEGYMGDVKMIFDKLQNLAEASQEAGRLLQSAGNLEKFLLEFDGKMVKSK